MKPGPHAIDLIVPVYRNAGLTSRCLDSIAAHVSELAGIDIRLLVINDSPDDLDVVRLLETFAARHVFAEAMTNPVNVGFVGTANRGLKMAREAGRDAILINSDTETYPGTLRELVRVAHLDPQIAFVSPRSNNASLCSLPHADRFDPVSQPEAYERWKLLSAGMPRYHFTPTAVGFYLYIKHAVLANIGLLDEGFGVGYEEENDLIMRAGKVGYRAALANHAFAYHVSSASFKLTSLDLTPHRERNLEVMKQRHPEFLPLLKAYESSPHFRAEGLVARCLGDGGKIPVAFDLSSVGCDFNGTNEFAVAVLSSLCRRHGETFAFTVLCTRPAFKFHGLNRLPSLRRLEGHEIPLVERFAVAIRLAQPFDADAVTRLAELACVNVYVMHDTIALDCGYLSIERPIEALWGQVARHASGLCYISQFSQRTFEARFPEAARLPKYTRLSSTRLADYKKAVVGAAEHVLILGNHYAHKASDATAAVLAAAFPEVRFVVLGSDIRTRDNLVSHRSGLLSDEEVEELYARARLIVLPSYVEGFGLGLVHALAANKVVLARDIPATREILATYRTVSGVVLYSDELDLVEKARAALQMTVSQVDDAGAPSWDDWADGLAGFCRSLTHGEDLFSQTLDRLKAADLLHRAEHGSTARVPARRPMICRSSSELLELEGEEFVHAAYWTVLDREPDPTGMEHFVTELEAGVPKITILARIRNSDEGQRKGLPLVGFRRAHLAHRLRSTARVSKLRS
jgi:GT2 family glycosyltransferase